MLQSQLCFSQLPLVQSAAPDQRDKARSFGKIGAGSNVLQIGAGTKVLQIGARSTSKTLLQ
jgi:hypothetical protein